MGEQDIVDLNNSMVRKPVSVPSIFDSVSRGITQNLWFFLIIYIISLVVYLLIQFFAKSDCQDSKKQCSDTWRVLPPGTVTSTVLAVTIAVIIIWLISFFVLSRIRFGN